MKVAVIGSRNLIVTHLENYLPEGVTEIVSGGARGIDTCARDFAKANHLKLTEFLPEYEKYGKGAPLKRNLLIIDYADEVLAFWDGNSRGTKYVIENCKKKHKKIGSSRKVVGWSFHRRQGEITNQFKEIVIITISITDSFGYFDFVVETLKLTGADRVCCMSNQAIDS